MIDLGIRLEFFDPATLDTERRRLLGALCRTSGYMALDVPAIGTRVSVSSLRLTTSNGWQPFVLGSTLRVIDVIHEPVPYRQGSIPSWWGEGAREPSATIVLRAALRGSSIMLLPRLRQFVGDGWRLESAVEGSELQRAWHMALREREAGGCSANA